MTALNDSRIRALVPTNKAQRHFDGNGLYLEVSTTGAKLWRLKYRFAGKEKRLALGAYPEVGLKAARDKTMEERRRLRDGVDPGVARRAARASTVAEAASLEAFEIVAREWHLVRHTPSC